MTITGTEVELESRNWQLCDNINAPWIVIDDTGGDCVPKCDPDCCVQIRFEDNLPATVRVIIAPTGGAGGSGSDQTMTVPLTGIINLCVPSGHTIAVEDGLGCNELKEEC